MKIAHLILVHKNPAQTERLIRALDHPAFDFYIHIDKKTDITPFQHLFRSENVFPIHNRTKIYWAGFGTIQATINGFREIPDKYAHINVMSGQDFPLKPAAYIYNYMATRRNKEFITCESIDGPWNVAPRVRKYHLVNWQIPGRYRLEKLVNAILPPRKFPFDHEIVGRANWFALTQEAVRFCMDFLDSHPELIRYYKYCWGADEFIFSTILYNSRFRENIIDYFMYVDWSGGQSRPKILGKEDFTPLINSGKLLARKFDMDHDETIFTLLEEHLKKDAE